MNFFFFSLLYSFLVCLFSSACCPLISWLHSLVVRPATCNGAIAGHKNNKINKIGASANCRLSHNPLSPGPSTFPARSLSLFSTLFSAVPPCCYLVYVTCRMTLSHVLLETTETRDVDNIVINFAACLQLWISILSFHKLKKKPLNTFIYLYWHSIFYKYFFLKFLNFLLRAKFNYIAYATSFSVRVF